LSLHVGATEDGEELRVAREEEQVEALADAEPVVVGQNLLPRRGHQLAVNAEQASVLGRFLQRGKAVLSAWRAQMKAKEEKERKKTKEKMMCAPFAG
jgi:hypothetical protein